MGELNNMDFLGLHNITHEDGKHGNNEERSPKHSSINVGALDIVKQPSVKSRISRRGSPVESEEDSDHDDFGAIGKEILTGLKGPRKTRMGDIYHSIKATVDKMAKNHQHKKEVKKRNHLPHTQKGSHENWEHVLKANDSEESLPTIPKGEKEQAYADALRETIMKDPKLAMDSNIMGKFRCNEYLLKKKMQPPKKIGDNVVHSGNIDQLIDMVKRNAKAQHYSKPKIIKEIRELMKIFFPTVNDDGEYISKKKKIA